MIPKNRLRLTVFFMAISLSIQYLPARATGNVKLPQITPFTFEPGKDFKEGEIIVSYKKQKIDLKTESGKKKAQGLEKARGLQKLAEIDNLNMRVVKTSEPIEKAIQWLKNDPNVEFAEPNYIRQPSAIPSDIFFADQWGLHNTGQVVDGTIGTADSDIDAPEAWDLEADQAAEVVVAVIDTGVNLTHEDLAGNIWTNPFEIPSNGIDDDNNGYIDDVHGWDFKDNDNDPNDSAFPFFGDDISGHGTSIAGIIAGVSDNGIGISGASRKNKIKIMPLRFDLDTASEVMAINYAKNNGAEVINASFGGNFQSLSEKAAISFFPGIFATASGNESVNNESFPLYPCSYAHANIVCVASTDQNDSLSTFSNYGATSVDIAAPGQNILSTYVGSDSAYIIGSGTSFAAPFVAGSAALLYSKNPGLMATEVKDRLLLSGDNLKTCSVQYKVASGKRLNVGNAMNSSFSPVSAFKCPPVHRFWSYKNQGHFYTMSETEKNHIMATYPENVWKYEGIAYESYGDAGSGLVAVHRFWSDKNQGHFFTASEDEKNHVIATYPENVWKYEGIAYYADPAQQAGTTAVFRFWSDQNQRHFYTSSEAEKNHVITTYPENVWKFEGIAWYVPTE